MRLSTLMLAAAMAAAPLFAAAQVSVNINVPGIVTVAPPPPRFERMPPPRVGYVWVPGRWQWQQEAYGWRQGFWQPARRDHVYAPGRWARADGGWRWVEPDWRPSRRHGHRDHDHDRDYHRYERHGHDDHRHGGDHCPPGQAKKGRC